MAISQSIMFGDLTQDTTLETAELRPNIINGVGSSIGAPVFVIDDLPHGIEPGEIPRLTKSEEDALLRESTSDFPDWVASFIRRVILLFENLPEDTGGEVRSSTESEREFKQSISRSYLSISCDK